MIVYNNETIKNAIMDALDKMERGIEISEVDRNELIDVILKYGDRDFGIKNGNRKYTEEELQNSVYIHIVNENNKCYVGQTCQKPKDRWRCGSRYKSQVFYNAIDKYAWDNISHIVICNGLSQEQANKMEVVLISLFKSNDKEFGYNISNGGDGIGKHSDESRNKMSNAHKGKYVGENSPNAKKVLCNKQIFTTAKECAKFYNVKYKTMCNWLIGKRTTPCEFIEKGLRYATQDDIDTYPLYIEESENKIIEGRNGENDRKGKKVLCNGQIFTTAKECAKFYNVNYSTMRSWLIGKRTTPYEFTKLGLRYATQDDIDTYPPYIEEEQNQQKQQD